MVMVDRCHTQKKSAAHRRESLSLYISLFIFYSFTRMVVVNRCAVDKFTIYFFFAKINGHQFDYYFEYIDFYCS